MKFHFLESPRGVKLGLKNGAFDMSRVIRHLRESLLLGTIMGNQYST